MYNQTINVGPVALLSNGKAKKEVYLEGAMFYTNPAKPNQVAADVPPRKPRQAFENDGGNVFDCLKPMIMLNRIAGIFPIGYAPPGIFKVTAALLIYSVLVFLAIVSFIIYIKWDRIELVRTVEGRFEEAVIFYLFTVYLLPIVCCPMIWYESRKVSKVFTDWIVFEKIYIRITSKKLPLFLGNKPLMTTIALPILSCGTMIITHITMANFRFVQVVPYCYINSIMYLIGGIWYLHCKVIGKIATAIADDFEMSLRHVGPSTRVADYRSLWMLLSRITRDAGNGYCYSMTFISLYLFLTITLTIYGLLSQLQEGFGIKDVGLTITAVFSVALLFFVCDEAHYASNCVRVYFQKKLLLVELSWMNEDAQQEINMFLRATEMNPTDMSLGGFFDVNRTLFKSLLATMVTYLVVLLQFQISIPTDVGFDDDSKNASVTTTAPK